MDYGIYNRETKNMIYKGMSREEAFAYMETDSTGVEGIARWWNGAWHGITENVELNG